MVLESLTHEERQSLLENLNVQLIKLDGMCRILEVLGNKESTQLRHGLVLREAVPTFISLRKLKSEVENTVRRLTVIELDQKIENQKKLKEQLLQEIK